MGKILQYLWVKKYGCIEKEGFNFTRRAIIQFDWNTNKLTLEENNNFCEDFYGNSIEISCVVGQNGTGKTTLLRAIKEILDEDYGEISYECIVIYYSIEDKKYWLWNNLSKSIIYDCGNIIEKEKPWDNSEFLYYSDVLSVNQYKKPMGHNELSTSFLLYDEIDLHNEPKDHVHSFFLSEFERQMNFILDYKEGFKLFHIQYPPFVIGDILINDNIFKEYIKKHNCDDKDYEVYKSYFKISSKDSIVYFKECLARSMFLNIIYTFSHTYDDPYEIIESIIIFMKKNNSWDSWNNLYKLLSEDGKSEKQYYLNLIHKREEYISFMKFIDSEVVYNNAPFKFLRLGISRNAFSIALDNNNPESNIDILTDIRTFFGKYRNAADFHNFISFSWNLSSGEESLINLFSRLYSSKIIKCITKEKTIVMLLDEIDATFHPEWQRYIVKELKEFVQKAFNGCYVQIIMTTHSPIMLSDIPKQNVLFVKTDKCMRTVEGCDTFASNIFQLFREGFFIGDTGIGVYAEEKLKEIVDHIHNNDIEDNKLKKLIASVGDTFLRNKLNEEYLMYRSQNNGTEKIQAERIAELESANTELLKQQRLEHEEKANNRIEAEKILKKLDNLNDNEEKNMEVTETKKKPMDDLADVIREFMQRFID